MLLKEIFKTSTGILQIITQIQTIFIDSLWNLFIFLYFHYLSLTFSFLFFFRFCFEGDGSVFIGAEMG